MQKISQKHRIISSYMHLKPSIDTCTFPHFCPINISLHIYPPTIQFLICTTRSPRHSRLHQPAVGLLPRHYLIGGRRVTPRITQRPFVLGRCPASDTHGGCTRQAALRARGTPGAAPALLLRGIPGEARTERKGMFFPVQCHVVPSACCVCG